MLSADISSLLCELQQSLHALDPEQQENLLERIIEANRVFVAGTGRSGLVAKGFAMRLMQLGKDAYVVGETITPAIRQGDLLLVASGSGETKSLIANVQVAAGLGAKVATITTNPQSTIAQFGCCRIVIKAASKKDADSGSDQPMGTLFEQALHILLDYFVLCLMNRMEKTSDMLYEKHANLE